MNEKHIYNLILDSEFQRLDYFDTETIKMSLDTQPLLVWHKILISGYRGYEQYHKQKIPFSIKELDFETRYEVISYICQHYLKDSNTTQNPDEHFRYRVGKLYAAVKSILLEKYPIQNQYTKREPENLRKEGTSKAVTVNLLKGIFNISPGSVYKYGRYAVAIDCIAEKCPTIADDILQGIFHLSQEDTIKISKMSAPEITVIRDHVVNNGDTRLLQSSIMRAREQEKKKAKLLAEERKNTPEIKQMPKYDPDAGLSSLTFTIPMWVSSINRAIESTDFTQASTAALWKLEHTLLDLSETIEMLRKKIEERYHE